MPHETDYKLFRDAAVHSTESLSALRLPNKNLPLVPIKAAGEILYNTVDQVLYYSDGTAWLKLFGVAPTTGAVCLTDVDGDTYVCVDDGADNDDVKIVAADDVKIVAADDISLTPGSGQTAITGATITGGAALAATATLLRSDSGTTYSVSQSSSVRTITLPAQGSLPGMFFRFVLTAADSAHFLITSSAEDDISGSYDNGGAAEAVDSEGTVQFTGGTAVVGDTVELYGLAAGWYFTGRTTATDGIEVYTNGP